MFKNTYTKKGTKKIVHVFLKSERNSNKYLNMKKEIRSRQVPKNGTIPLNALFPSTV